VGRAGEDDERNELIYGSCGRFGVPVCPHAGGVGLCEYVIHLRYEWPFLQFLYYSLTSCSLIDYIAVSGTMSTNVLEFADHLHEHFVHPVSINNKGRYNVPVNPDEGYRSIFVQSSFCIFLLTSSSCSIEMHKASIVEYEWPNGTYWVGAKRKA
jgi:L-fuconate dehydratase